jgi:eukaryotic-like serine/threonine-protein kinase
VFEFPTDFGRYRLVGIAGEGGMATVYRAVLPGPHGFEKKLVVKVIRPALIEDEEFVRALVNEALLGCQLHHPNIVEVYEFNHYNGRYYLAMELVDGISLSYLIKRHRKVKHQVPIPVLLLVLNQILEGLDYAHNARSGDDGSLLQVIHRDLKPSNIAIAPNGMVKLIDFGIARATIDRGGMETSGAIRGTPRYMSPEQIETPNEMTPASDLFSLGALLYEMVTTKPLFKARPGQDALDLVLRLDLDEHVDRVEAVLPGLGEIFTRLTRRPVAQRYTSAVGVMGDLKPLIDEHGDRDAARAYLAMLVAEYKEDLNAEELIPEDFEPVISSAAPTTTRRREAPPETKPLPAAILSLELGPDGQHATEVLATIPLPPRPEELITGRRQQLGPGSNASGTTATHATGDRPYQSVDPSSSMSVGFPSKTTATVRETGANWGLVAALAVPLVVLVLVMVMVGGGALMSRMGAPAGADPYDDGIHGGGMIVIEDGGEETPVPAEVIEDPIQTERDRIAREKRHAERDRRRQEEAEAEERGKLGASDGDRGSTTEVEEDPTPDRRETTERTPAPDEDPEPSGDPGTLVVDADPWATVWVDGKYEGETPISVKVSAGHHTITMKCMGDGPEHTRRVTVNPGSREPYFRQFTESQCP